MKIKQHDNAKKHDSTSAENPVIEIQVVDDDKLATVIGGKNMGKAYNWQDGWPN